MLHYKTLYFNIVTIISCTFFSSNEQQLAGHTQKSAWSSKTWLVFHIAVTTAEKYYPFPPCVRIHSLVSINIQQKLTNDSGCNFFHMGEFILISMSDTNLSDCPSTVICHTATKCNRILMGMLNFYCHITNICL